MVNSKKMTFISMVAAIAAAGLLALSSRSDAQERGPYTRQSADEGGGGGAKVGVVSDQCPDNYYISAFQTIKDNPDQRAINVWYKPLPLVEKMPDDLSEKGPIRTKEAVSNGGGPKAECPDHYYTSAFQLRVDDDSQRSIDFWCKSFPKVEKKSSNLAEKIEPASTCDEPINSGGSYRVQSPDGYFISAIQIFRSPGPAWPKRPRSVVVWFTPVRQN